MISFDRVIRHMQRRKYFSPMLLTFKLAILSLRAKPPNLDVAALMFDSGGHHRHATSVKLKEKVSPTPTRGHEATLEGLHPWYSLD